jgi:hypothetical protein
MLAAIITKCHDNVTGGLIFVLPCKESGKSTFGFFISQMSNRASTVPRTTAEITKHLDDYYIVAILLWLALKNLCVSMPEC